MCYINVMFLFSHCISYLMDVLYTYKLSLNLRICICFFPYLALAVYQPCFVFLLSRRESGLASVVVAHFEASPIIFQQL